ncbi:hypothetical protein HNR60_001151 [Rhodopseudomonas rhenobacensis]|uniref:Uncharacterized protein n=1 Tax=Rhodopseudomonas rhenobacensis TaxID=87461 RepID=A0A7W7Z1R2_9BRAD|nr:hypothetical protein [Rhodopseudomonas rhenobacensis]MBB5046406.1 hypothetical protein [Rhodopseudomonas rhenobacensis]
MKRLLLSLALLYSATALAQTAPPTVGDRPLLQIKPKVAAAKPGKPGVASQLQACLEIEDGSRERLDCYDAVIAPQPKPKPPKVKAVTDCRYTKEQDERLSCFNGFVGKLAKPQG